MVRCATSAALGMRLSASSAGESWCLDNIVIPTAGLPAGQQLWARLKSAARNPRNLWPLLRGGINLATLIENFQPPSRPQQDRWSVGIGAVPVV